MVKQYRRYINWAFICLVFLSVLLPILPFRQHAQAATGYIFGFGGVKITSKITWINRATVKVEVVDVDLGDLDKDGEGARHRYLSNEFHDGLPSVGKQEAINNIKKLNSGTFTDNNLFDGAAVYGMDSCGQHLELFQVDNMTYNTGGSMQFHGEFMVTSVNTHNDNQCDRLFNVQGTGTTGSYPNSEAVFGIPEDGVNDLANRDLWFEFSDVNSVKQYGNGDVYGRASAELKNQFNFGSPDRSGCFRHLVIPQDQLDGSSNRLTGTFSSCDGRDDISVAIKRDNAEFGKGTGTDNNKDTTGNGQPKADCEVQTLNPLTWLMCPIITAGIDAVEGLDNAITSMLTFQTNKDSLLDEKSDKGGQALFNVWASFRYIALGFLVVIGLIMIISQALSFGVFDAYTIKKILPKILIGVIGISLSWYLCKFAIDIFNDLGVGVRSLLYGPFKGLNNAKFDAGAVSLLSFGAGFAFLGLGIIGILSFVVTALLAVVIAFGVLVFRRILIILLVVTAPLAIVCWILPNTERVWKMWWDFFIRALVVFPIIALFIAGGRVIAQIATLQSSANGQSNLLGSTIAFVSYFGPYFAIPAAFRLAGGAIATVGGLANDRGRGVFDRLKKGRQERFSNRVQRATNGGLYNKQTRRGRIGNKIAGTFFEPHNYAALYGSKAMSKAGWKNNILSKRASQIMGAIGNQTVDETQEAFQHINKIFNDKGYQALSGAHRFGGTSRTVRDAAGNFVSIQKRLEDAGLWGKAPSTYEEFMKFGEILKDSDDHTERIGGRALQSEAGYLSSLNSNADTTQVSLKGLGAMGWAQHGFATPDDLKKIHNSMVDGREGEEIAGLLTTRAQLLGQDKRADLKLGYGSLVFDEHGHASSVYDDAKRTSEMIKTFKQSDLLGTKSGAIKDMAWKTVKNPDGTERRVMREGGLIDLAMNDTYNANAAEKQAAQERIMLGASMYSGSDDDAKAAYKEMAAFIDAQSGSNLVAQIQATDREMTKARQTMPGGPGPAGPVDPTAAGAPPAPSV